MDKKIIYRDTQGEAEFTGAVRDTAERSNELIILYNAFQPWEVVNTFEAFLELATDPATYFDRALRKNINMEAIGKVKPDLERLAELFGLERSTYLNILKGAPVDLNNCEACKKAKVRRGKPCINLREFTSYKAFLQFAEGTFTVDEIKVKAHLLSFTKFAETQEELEIISYWEKLAEVFNYHFKTLGLIGPSKLEEACKAFGLRFVDNTVYTNSDTIYNQILKLRK